jgi:hypothetical protein
LAGVDVGVGVGDGVGVGVGVGEGFGVAFGVGEGVGLNSTSIPSSNVLDWGETYAVGDGRCET